MTSNLEVFLRKVGFFHFSVHAMRAVPWHPQFGASLLVTVPWHPHFGSSLFVTVPWHPHFGACLLVTVPWHPHSGSSLLSRFRYTFSNSGIPANSYQFLWIIRFREFLAELDDWMARQTNINSITSFNSGISGNSWEFLPIPFYYSIPGIPGGIGWSNG